MDSIPIIGPAEGTYIVTGTDSVNCSNTYQFTLNTEFCPREPYFLIVPNVFTPNGDGNNDRWKIPGLDNQPNAKIYIFDRYGKLLVQLSPTGSGWDGTYNGTLVRSDDYWFSVNFIEPITGEPKTFKAHFTLKR